MQEIKIVKQSALKAIRQKCLECSGGSYDEVRLCPVTRCPLHPHRFGKTPKYEEYEEMGLPVVEREKQERTQKQIEATEFLKKKRREMLDDKNID